MTELTKEFKDEAWREVLHAIEQYEEGHILFSDLKSVVLNYLGHLVKHSE